MRRIEKNIMISKTFKNLVSGFFVFSLFVSGTVLARTIFLNGVDISAAKSQDLKNVTVHIDERGDVYISAPHYQVNEENTFMPLSKYVQGLNAPKHESIKPAPVSGMMTTPENKVPSLSEQSSKETIMPGELPKGSIATPSTAETPSNAQEAPAGSPNSNETKPAEKVGSKATH